MDFSKGTPCQFFFWIAGIFALFWRATPPKKGEERYFSSTNFNFKLTCQKWTFLRGPHVNFFLDCSYFCTFLARNPPKKGGRKILFQWESAKECVTTHLPKQLALKMDGAKASHLYPAVQLEPGS